MDKLVSSCQQCPVHVHKALRAQSDLLNGTGFESCTCKLFAFFALLAVLVLLVAFVNSLLLHQAPKSYPTSRDSFQRSSKERLRLPFPCCSKEEACALLKYIYVMDRSDSDVMDDAPKIMELAHRYNMGELLDSIKRALSRQVTSSGDSTALWVNHKICWHSSAEESFLQANVHVHFRSIW